MRRQTSIHLLAFTACLAVLSASDASAQRRPCPDGWHRHPATGICAPQQKRAAGGERANPGPGQTGPQRSQPRVKSGSPLAPPRRAFR